MKEESKKLSVVSRVLIIDQAIGNIISIFLDTFFAAYFYKISEQNIFYLSIYNIVSLVTATIGAFIVSDIIKRKNKINLFRFGMLFEVFNIFLIIILKEKILNYICIMGIISGISTATTGFPLNMIESENVSNNERSKYLGYSRNGKRNN